MHRHHLLPSFAFGSFQKSIQWKYTYEYTKRKTCSTYLYSSTRCTQHTVDGLFDSNSNLSIHPSNCTELRTSAHTSQKTASLISRIQGWALTTVRQLPPWHLPWENISFHPLVIVSWIGPPRDNMRKSWPCRATMGRTSRKNWQETIQNTTVRNVTGIWTWHSRTELILEPSRREGIVRVKEDNLHWVVL